MEKRKQGGMESMTTLVYYVALIVYDKRFAHWLGSDIRFSDHLLDIRFYDHVLEMIPSFHSQFTFTIHQRMFVVLKVDGISFCAIVDEALGKRKALRFLEQVRDEFKHPLLGLDLMSSTFDIKISGFKLSSKFVELVNQLVKPLAGIPQKRVDVQPSELHENDTMKPFKPSPGAMATLVSYVAVIACDKRIAHWLGRDIRFSDHLLDIRFYDHVLEMIPSFHRQFTFTIHQRMFVVLKVDRISLCAIVDEALGKRKALRFLQQVRDEFKHPLLGLDLMSSTFDTKISGVKLSRKFVRLVDQLVKPLAGIPQKRVDVQPSELHEDDTMLDLPFEPSPKSSALMMADSGHKTIPKRSSQKFPHGSSRGNHIRSSSTSVEDSEPSPARKPNDCILEDVVKKYAWNHVLQMMDGSSCRQLGKGGFGTVYLGKLETGREVAVKILHRSSHQGEPEFFNEVNLLRRVNHVNLVRLLGFCLDKEQVLLYEFAEEGSVWDHLHGDREWLDWRQRLSIALQSACGLEYLHTMCNPRILHRDIKSENILLTKTMVAKVADFGSSRLGADDNNNWKTHVTTKVMGTRGYLDPEYHLTGQLRDSSDVFSFGIVLLEIITGRKPVPNQDPKCAITNWVGKSYGSGGSKAVKAVADPLFSDNYNPKALKLVINLALSCTNPSGESRPKISEVVHVLRKAQTLELVEKNLGFLFYEYQTGVNELAQYRHSRLALSTSVELTQA